MTEKTLAEHFHEYFSICIGRHKDLKKEVFKLRCDVYCKELGYEKVCHHCENGEDCEIDDFDRYSEYVLIKHRATGIYAGCVRLVAPPQMTKKLYFPLKSTVYNPSIQKSGIFTGRRKC